LQVNVLLRVGATGCEDLGDRHFELFAAKLFVDLDLDGKTVAVVAGDVGGIEPSHGLRFDDEVFQALVQGMAEVNRAVGVGRSVVEKVSRAAGTGFAQFFVEADGIPFFEPKRLILRQIRLHGECSLRQGQGRLQLRRWRHWNSLVR
jgi:hypothetical protein